MSLNFKNVKIIRAGAGIWREAQVDGDTGAQTLSYRARWQDIFLNVMIQKIKG